MANAAYQTIHDGVDHLKFGDDSDKQYTFGCDGVDGGVQSVLSFIVTPTVNADGSDDDVELEMVVNGQTVVSQLFASSQGRAWHEIVPRNVLKAKNNTLVARLADADKKGEAAIGDIYITYTTAP